METRGNRRMYVQKVQNVPKRLAMQLGVCDPQFGLDRLLGWDTMPDPANAKSASDCPSLQHIHFQNQRGAKRSMFLGRRI